jgi:hypothetical protein
MQLANVQRMQPTRAAASKMAVKAAGVEDEGSSEEEPLPGWSLLCCHEGLKVSASQTCCKLLQVRWMRMRA